MMSKETQKAIRSVLLLPILAPIGAIVGFFYMFKLTIDDVLKALQSKLDREDNEMKLRMVTEPIEFKRPSNGPAAKRKRHPYENIGDGA